MYSDYLTKKTGDIAERNVTTLDESTNIATAARVMREKGISSVLVGKNNNPVGIVTEKDILYRVVAESKGPFKITLGEIMSSPLVVIDETAPVRDAVSTMRKKEIRRMPVTSKGRIVGLLTLRSIVGDTIESRVELAETVLPPGSTVMCPYCQSKFEDKQDLSKHIDRLHLGAGLLEGDMRQW